MNRVSPRLALFLQVLFAWQRAGSTQKLQLANPGSHHRTQPRDHQISSPGNHQDIQPALQAAVDEAGNGDQLILTEGEFILNKSVLIKKLISPKGQGPKSTILYRPESLPDSVLSARDWRCMITFDIRSDTPSHIVLTDIGFRSKKPMVVEGDGGSRVRTEGVRMVQCLDFMIKRCRFEVINNAGISVIHKDTIASGLIRNNEYYYNAGAGFDYGVAVFI